MTMPARAYNSPDPLDDDFFYPEDEPRRKVMVRCRCGVRSINFRIAQAAIDLLRLCNPPAALVVGSDWCRQCKTLSKVTARALHLSR